MISLHAIRHRSGAAIRAIRALVRIEGTTVSHARPSSAATVEGIGRGSQVSRPPGGAANASRRAARSDMPR